MSTRKMIIRRKLYPTDVFLLSFLRIVNIFGEGNQMVRQDAMDRSVRLYRDTRMVLCRRVLVNDLACGEVFFLDFSFYRTR